MSPARRTAFDALFLVESEGAYANLALAQVLGRQRLDEQQAATCTELVNGTARLQGTYDRIIEAASGRPLSSLQPAVVTVLRLATHELLGMRTPTHSAVDEAVQLARVVVGQRVTGVVNAIARRVAAHDLAGWLDVLTADADDDLDRLALRTHHPRWVVDAYADVLPADELEAALAANNVAPTTSLVVRPGLATVDELVAAGARANPDVPTGASTSPVDDSPQAHPRGTRRDRPTTVPAHPACHPSGSPSPPPAPDPLRGVPQHRYRRDRPHRDRR